MKIYRLYQELSKKYGHRKDFWSKWCKKKKSCQEKEEIVMGAVLTQRTNWKNVELALKNLEKAGALSIKRVYQIGKKNPKLLESFIRPAGFYRQKTQRLFQLCKFIIEKHQSLGKFFKQDLVICRSQLLEIFGIGPETADSILLYAGSQPIFVIDEYTRRFVKKHKITDKFSYNYLQQLFQQNLPKNPQIYQDFHAMIVLDGQGRFL